MITLRASGLARIMKCFGPLNMKDLPEYESGAPAMEGTAAGEMLQAMLEQRTIVPQIGKHASNGVAFDDDMIFHVTPIASEILKNAQSEILCETEVNIVTRSGVQIKGHSDVTYIRDGKLYVDDLKYGWGIVDVKENWQLLAYAIGEVMRRGQVFPSIVLRIHQPRPHHEDGSTREWEITYEELLQRFEVLEARCDQIAAGSRELVTGNHCKYCPAASHACPAFNRAYHAGVDYILSDFKQDDINESEIAFQLDQLQRISDVLKVKKDSIEQLANYRIKEGAIIPGWMTEQKLGDRKWKSSISPQAIEVMTGKKIVKETILSPAQAEKLGVPKDLVKTLVDRHLMGVTLVKKDAGKLADKIFNNK